MEIEIKKVFAGPDHIVALGDYGRCYSLGTGLYGWLGLGDKKNRLKICRVTALEPYYVIDVACGIDFTVFLVNSDWRPVDKWIKIHDEQGKPKPLHFWSLWAVE